MDELQGLSHDELVRLEALREAIRMSAIGPGEANIDIVTTAGKYETFIRNGSDNA